MVKHFLAPAGQAIAEQVAAWAVGLKVAELPAGLRARAEEALIDHLGLVVSARRAPYVAAILAGLDSRGDCTAFGQKGGFDMAGAALLNGTAAHGEDYDDTFEGTPMHPSAAIIPAVLAAAEHSGASGEAVLCGIVAGAELMCRMAIVAPMAQHRAGFHPTAVAGAMGAAAGVSVVLGLTAQQTTDALGIAGSMASGIIEYLAEGTWTKRLHPGWAAQSGIRAAHFARGGFKGPRTVFEGEHGFFYAFGTADIPPDVSRLTADLGDQWHFADVAFKPYACGTMVQPFIDCAITLAREGLDPAQIDSVTCKVGEGTVHRLWEPLSEKRQPSTPYSAKFSVPYGVAVGFLDREAGLRQFTDERIRDAALLDLAGRIRYEIDPLDEYPRNYTGTVIATLKDGSTRTAHQPHLRGGRRERLPRGEVLAKFRANCRFGGWDEARIDALLRVAEGLFSQENMLPLAAFRG
ncbi:MmgE/PrpD family protein [Albidovulum sediminis]|uniref:MmgE/PrpD family protein n=1 Tax=Albidovulum sediminis TaxID=3066345 RepID=A0ABT2NRR9_9RHOB|nr:MmgE/PrpD family protein [Defluviimonas sediminis]MCT8331584.1 MmgE/PrpD family protein [Defluviimonas sediminis]